MVLVANSGPHFDANAVVTWLDGEGQKHLYTAPRRPCSDGKAEKFTSTLKTSIYSIAASTFDGLGSIVDTRGNDSFFDYEMCRVCM